MTICTQKHSCLFGEVSDGEARLNLAGEMVQKWWKELETKFPEIVLDEYVVMPNHFHGIITIVGADLCVCPFSSQKANTSITKGEHIGSPLRETDENTIVLKGEYIGSSQREKSLSSILQWFKTMTTNEYIRGVKSGIFPPFEKSFWQRNYYEHVIRNEDDLNRIREYIANNPKNWRSDELFFEG